MKCTQPFSGQRAAGRWRAWTLNPEPSSQQIVSKLCLAPACRPQHAIHLSQTSHFEARSSVLTKSTPSGSHCSPLEGVCPPVNYRCSGSGSAFHVNTISNGPVKRLVKIKEKQPSEHFYLRSGCNSHFTFYVPNLSQFISYVFPKPWRKQKKILKCRVRA